MAAREPAIASEALAHVSPADLNTASGQAIAGSVAILQKDWPVAEEHFAAAAKLDAIRTQTSRLNLASPPAARAGSPGAAESRAELDRLRAIPATQLPALRSLLADARARSARDEARKFATDLHGLTQVTYADRLALLDELASASLRVEGGPGRRAAVGGG